MAPSGIEPATFGLVVQCLNQLRHRVPLTIIYGRLQNWTWEAEGPKSSFIMFDVMCNLSYNLKLLETQMVASSGAVPV